jgi:hypothetical protein
MEIMYSDELSNTILMMLGDYENRATLTDLVQ